MELSTAFPAAFPRHLGSDTVGVFCRIMDSFRRSASVFRTVGPASFAAVDVDVELPGPQLREALQHPVPACALVVSARAKKARGTCLHEQWHPPPVPPIFLRGRLRDSGARDVDGGVEAAGDAGVSYFSANNESTELELEATMENTDS